jgi:hypothetical protein
MRIMMLIIYPISNAIINTLISVFSNLSIHFFKIILIEVSVTRHIETTPSEATDKVDLIEPESDMVKDTDSSVDKDAHHDAVSVAVTLSSCPVCTFSGSLVLFCDVSSSFVLISLQRIQLQITVLKQLQVRQLIK